MKELVRMDKLRELEEMFENVIVSYRIQRVYRRKRLKEKATYNMSH